MVLVSYSDSEGSENEGPQAPQLENTTAALTRPDLMFTVDRSNPRKIRVNLPEVKVEPTINRDHEEEPAPKRPRTGGGFGGFNSILPAPKKDTQANNGHKAASNGAIRKVFSLKTGAEPVFSRESDAELKQLLAEQETNSVQDGSGSREVAAEEEIGTGRVPALSSISQPAPPSQRYPMLFKPLSVARNTPRRKKPSTKMAPSEPASHAQIEMHAHATETIVSGPKLNLFSIGNPDPKDTPSAQQGEYKPFVYHNEAEEEDATPSASNNADTGFDGTVVERSSESQPQSLDAIAADLNLSASAKRQLLGRNHNNASKISSSIINFNTDQEYAANEALRASGEQVQHNPVRAIAPGKHSLKQLVNAASGQKEALEESFASGRRNKKEAGGKYGW